MDNTPNELEQWQAQARHWHDEAERLRKELEAKQQIASPPSSLINNSELLIDMARYAEGLYTREQIKKKWREVITEDTWKKLGEDDTLVDAIEAEKIRRIRNGQAKREKAQSLVVKQVETLDSIASDKSASPRHRVDAIKVLDGMSDTGPHATPTADKFVIHIDLSGDCKLKGVEPDPKDIINLEVTLPQKTITDGSDD
jgi:hypothetical protein